MSHSHAPLSTSHSATGKPAVLVEADFFAPSRVSMAVQTACVQGVAADLRAWCVAPPSAAMWQVLSRSRFNLVSAADSKDALDRIEAHCRVLSSIKSRPSEVWLCMEPARASRLIHRLHDVPLKFVVFVGRQHSSFEALSRIARVIDLGNLANDVDNFALRRAKTVEQYLEHDVHIDNAPGVAVAVLSGNLHSPLLASLMNYASAFGPVICSDTFSWQEEMDPLPLLHARKLGIGLHWGDTRLDAELNFVRHVVRLSQSIPRGSRMILCASASQKIERLAGLIRDAGMLPHLVRAKGSAEKQMPSEWASIISVNNLPRVESAPISAYELASIMPGGIPLSSFVHGMGLQYPIWPAGAAERYEARDQWIQSLRDQFPELWIGRSLVRPARLVGGVPAVAVDLHSEVSSGDSRSDESDDAASNSALRSDGLDKRAVTAIGLH